jgi:spore coat polysaccharide biosynthesis protein SpsF
MRIVAITQARSGSTRLPNKILMKVGGQSLLELHVNRMKQSKLIDKLIIATTTAAQDAQIVDLAKALETPSFRGSENNVLDRFYQAVKNEGADYVVRLTSDCPLIDAVLIDKVIQYALDNNLDYCSNTLNPTYPDGQDVEVFKFAALEKAWNEATLESDCEHVTPYIWRNSTFKNGSIFKSDNFGEGYDFEKIRMTVDEQRDYELIVKLVEQLGSHQTWLAYAEFMVNHADLLAINSNIQRNEGFFKSLKKDKNG